MTKEAHEKLKAADAKRAADEAAARGRQKVAVVTVQRKAEAAECQDTLRSIPKEGIIRLEHRERRGLPLGQLQHAEQARMVGRSACPGLRYRDRGPHRRAEGTPERNLRLSERRARPSCSI